MNVLDYTIQHLIRITWIELSEKATTQSDRSRIPTHPHRQLFQPLGPLKQWLDRLEVRDRQMAHSLCKLIPAQCPFERDIKVCGRVLFHIPPLCKLNPFYDQFVGLRFRALCYLADECGEDVTVYC
ncbi:Mo-dependent nitrogenase C-terminal domain-containing protein [Phormidium pseudopriestleyi FRX01]|uniref:Mo-dependent nitrogenase C-terminal domain-containing protein n=1 Tax=Phormidium pseudopriestleyi FRX01 TaxID=1759528 RepID=A0ABS3FXL0_9CYAN|nr:Mo-dependent nitrogenase C-terminal domain-containing protein [Phormidium pseudopriestleyi]MBO0351873.1 Mo-dependent nitrogenase C-terminal domain-containing protein [Phormidium pseudopriestleyi FRX01]